MYACIYCDPDFSCGCAIQSEVVQEVLADLKRRRLDDANNALLQSSWFKILVHQEQSLAGSDKRLGRVEPGARITPGEKHFVGTDKTLSGPNFGNMGQGFRATMHEVVQEGLSYLTFIVEKSLLEFSPKNLSKERMGKWWIHQPSRIPLSCTTNTQFL